MSAAEGRARRWGAVLLLLHAALGAWAVAAWGSGPFRGAAVLDGAEVLHLAVSGRADFIDSKSPLYPALLGLLLKTGASAPWTAGLLGIAASLAVLAGIGALCVRLGAPRAAPWAMGLYAFSGSTLAFIPQPLPVLPGTALLLWGSVALLPRLRPDPGSSADGGTAGQAAAVPAGSVSVRRAVAGGMLLAAAVLTLASLLLPALLVLGASLRQGAARTAAAGAGALAVVLLGALALPFPLWPEGAGLNLRLGNGGARSGTTDIRPGPAYDRLRLEPVIAAWEAGASRVDADAFHAARLAEEVAADPWGAVRTLGRKLHLFWQRTEIVTGADFRHGLAGMAPARLLLLSFGLVAPLALASLLRARRAAGASAAQATRAAAPAHAARPGAAVLLPVLGVLLVNLATLTSARYRFPALPFLCVAAGLWFACSPPLRAWVPVLVLGVLLNADLAGRPLTWPGDGELQQGELLLAQGAVDPAAVALARAAEAGADPRAAFMLGVAIDQAVLLHQDLSLRPQAEAWHREALARHPVYPEAADALMRSLIAQGRPEEALAFGQAYVARDPWAGAPRLTLAALQVQLRDKPATRALLVDGNRFASLAALARNDRAAAQRGSMELLRLAARDPALEALVAGDR